MSRSEKGQFLPGTHWREHQSFRDKEWLETEYLLKARSTGDIAAEFNVTSGAILFWLRKHGIPRRSTKQARRVKHWGVSGPGNPMWNMSGELNPNWKGGITADRQAFYASQEWKDACAIVWVRDKETCQRCGKPRSNRRSGGFHIHHIVSFAVEELRVEPRNLVLLCVKCHRFVHSKHNVNCEFLAANDNHNREAAA